ncbi:hypothetical protein CPB83DRAFT_144852 [Crepidotus variabilis]|uniref:Uncharacterized protein n=1 Tax=Crepidotus variabilis TaxID=179855 RepID=A0A9P6EL48_9AGAR|nr:hypothetical protein CPB83DRAFT_144852 [Crepidotus variabilis]
MPVMGAGAWCALMGLGASIFLRQTVDIGWKSPTFQERLDNSSRNFGSIASLQLRVLLCWPATMALWAYSCVTLSLAIVLTLGFFKINPSDSASAALEVIFGAIGTVFGAFATAQSLRAASVFV